MNNMCDIIIGEENVPEVTYFENIFSIFLDTEVFSVDMALYTPPALFKYLTALLSRARGELNKFLYDNPNKNVNISKMEDIVDFTVYDYKYNFFGNVFNEKIVPKPEKGSFFYIVLDNGIVIENYIYDDDSGKLFLELEEDIESKHSLFIQAYRNGFFNQKLNSSEIDLVIEGMGVYFMKDKIKNQKIYDQAIFSKDNNMHSQANHLTALKKANKEDYDQWKQNAYVYTYQHSPDNLSKLAVKNGGIKGGMNFVH